MENEQESGKQSQKMCRLRSSAIMRLRSIVPQPHVGKGAFGQLSYGFASMIGRRSYMEDSVTVAPREWLAGEYSFFAVYDGHGGAEVARKCGERLHKCLEKHIHDAGREAAAGGFDWEKVMMDTFSSMDHEIEEQQANKEGVGSTAVVVLVGKDDVVVANCGDSRAVLYRNKEVVPLSNDHKPEREDEKERIEAAGGIIINYYGCSRVQGVLATSRSLGDHFLRPYVISAPEVTVLKRSDLDDFLIIGSDGLFDVMSNKRACKVVKHSLFRTSRRRASKSGASEAAAVLVERAMLDGSQDNISAIVVKMA